VLAIGLLIGVVAIFLLIIMTSIIIRECKWQGDYVKMVKRAEGWWPILYQPDYELPGPNVPTMFKWVGIGLGVAWALFLVGLLLWWYDKLSDVFHV